MCDEVYLGRPHPQFKNTIRARPMNITERMIGEAFGISTRGEDAVRKGENLALSFFPTQSLSHTDGWQVKQCNDPTLKVVLAFLNPLLYPQKPHRVTVRMASTIVACLFHDRKTNWASVFQEVINKQVIGKQKLPTSVSCYLVHLYKHQNLLTASELDEYETHQEAVEGGNPEQRSATHSDETSDEEDVMEVSGPVTRGRNADPAKSKVPDWRDDLSDFTRVSIRLDAMNSWSPSEEFQQIQLQLNTGLRKSTRLEGVVQDCCQYLKCKTEDLFSSMKTAIEEGGKEKVARLEREKILDQNRIRMLEKKVKDLATTDELYQGLLSLGKSLRPLIGTEPELLVANNLLRQVYNDEKDPKLVKIISCNKKYAAEIQNSLSNLGESINKSMDFLVAHLDDLEFKEEGTQVPEPEPKTVPDRSGTGLRRLSGTMVDRTPTGSTSSASTPPFLRTLGQTTPQSTPVKSLPASESAPGAEDDSRRD